MNSTSLAVRVLTRTGLVLWSMLFLTVGVLLGAGA